MSLSSIDRGPTPFVIERCLASTCPTESRITTGQIKYGEVKIEVFDHVPTIKLSLNKYFYSESFEITWIHRNMEADILKLSVKCFVI